MKMFTFQVRRYYNMNIRCNQKCVFYKDRGIHFSVWLCRGYACTPALLGIFILPPGTMRIPTLPPAGRIKVAYQSFNRHRKPNFRCRRDKNIFSYFDFDFCHWYLFFPILILDIGTYSFFLILILVSVIGMYIYF